MCHSINEFLISKFLRHSTVGLHISFAAFSSFGSGIFPHSLHLIILNAFDSPRSHNPEIISNGFIPSFKISFAGLKYMSPL